MSLTDELELTQTQVDRVNLLQRQVYAKNLSLGMPLVYTDRVRRLSAVSVRANPGEPEYPLSDRPLARQRFERLSVAACRSPASFEKNEAEFLLSCYLAKALCPTALELIDEMHAQHFGDSPRPAPSLDKTT